MKTFIIIICLLFQSQLRADWTPTNGIYGGKMAVVFTAGEKVFASSYYGTVYFSNNNGMSYTIRSSGIKNVSISTFASIGNTVFAASYDSGIYKTSNDGITWHKSNSGLVNPRVTSLIVKDGRLYAGTNAGFYVSTNTGVSWTEPNSNFIQPITELTITNNIIFAAMSSYSLIMSSSDYGLSWDTSYYDMNNSVYFQTIDSKDSDIYASGFMSGIFRSTNSGLNWTFINNTPTIIYSIKILENKILIASGEGIFSSTDKGNTWNADSNGLPSYLSCRSIAADGNNIFLAVGDNYHPACIYRSSDQGLSWMPASSNIAGTYTELLYETGGKIYTSAEYKGLFYTTDHGDSWINANSDLPGAATFRIQSMGDCGSNYLLLAGRNYISTNSGQNWQVFGSSSNPHFYKFLTKDDTMLALKEYPWKSTNCGVSWFAIRNGYDAGNYGIELCYTGQYVYSISVTSVSTSSLFRSGDFGNNWVRTLYTSSGLRLNALAATENHVILGYTSNSDSGIMTSTDYGETFAVTNAGLTSRKVNTLYIVSDKILAGTDNGIFYKPVNGNTWYPFNNNFFNLNVNYFISDSVYIYAATKGDGVWRRPVSEIITDINENNISTEDFTLSQNFPNPFNPITKINFTLNQSSFTKLNVFDISGKKIKALVDGYTNEGSYSVSFDGSNFPSGVYLYRLEIDGNVIDTKRMVLLK